MLLIWSAAHAKAIALRRLLRTLSHLWSMATWPHPTGTEARYPSLRHLFAIRASSADCLPSLAHARLKQQHVAGRIVAQHGSAGGQPESSVASAEWDFRVEPQFGWGDPGGKQKATAGWLAALPVFEPHWQVLPWQTTVQNVTTCASPSRRVLPCRCSMPSSAPVCS